MVSGVVAATLPIVARILLIDHSPGQGLNASLNAFWGGLVAILLGILLIRNVAGYPGVERASAIITGFSVSFGILVVMLMMLRLDYSRLVLAGAYICAIFIFYLGYAQIFGRRRFKIAVIPLGDDILSVITVPGKIGRASCRERVCQ